MATINKETRNSFEDRIYDDLCEDILQFLPLEDKLRLECVSKLFKRTIFTKMKELTLDYYVDYHDKIVIDNLKRILNKFKQIEVKINGWKEKEVLEVIFNNADNVTMLKIAPYDGIEEECERLMVKRFGSTLKELSFWTFKVESHLRIIQNIEDLTLGYFVPELVDIHFEKLKKFTVFYFGFDNDDVDLLDKFAVKHSDQITQLNLWARYLDGEDKFRRVIRIVSKFTKLVSFSLGLCDFAITEKRFEPELNLLANNCKLIKSLDICYDCQTLSSLKVFKQLRRLDVRFDCDSINDQTFNGLQQLTHLTMYFNEKKIKDDFLKHIVNNLPNLRHLEVCIYEGVVIATEQTADVLRRLTKLESISMTISDQSIRSEIESKLIKNCKLIKNINIKII